MHQTDGIERSEGNTGQPPPPNDTTALNGGDAWHWFMPGGRDRSPTPMLRQKIIVASLFWAVLAIGLLMLVSSL